MTQPDIDTPYLADRIKDALATDERTHMLDIKIDVSTSSVCLSGSVSSEERRNAAEQVVRELVSYSFRLVNTLRVESYHEPSDTEALD
jgi:hypothetical protein